MLPGPTIYSPISHQSKLLIWGIKPPTLKTGQTE